MKIEPLKAEDYEFLGKTIEKYGHEQSVIDCSELDGFLTAIASSPELILPSEWMPMLWGGEATSPEWESKEEVGKFVDLVTAHFEFVSNCLNECPEQFEAMFLVAEDNETHIVDDWCFGYLRGVSLRSEMWEALPEDIYENLTRIYMFAADEHFEMIESLSDEKRAELVNNIEPAARELHKYWAANRSK